MVVVMPHRFRKPHVVYLHFGSDVIALNPNDLLDPHNRDVAVMLAGIAAAMPNGSHIHALYLPKSSDLADKVMDLIEGVGIGKPRLVAEEIGRELVEVAVNAT
jgi:hypothetical protein